jgi:esterase/lipase superfamily enzyme
LLCLLLILVGHSSVAQTDSEKTQISGKQALGRDLVGVTVKASNGAKVGEITDLIIEDGRVVGVVVSLGGFLGVGERSVSIDLTTLEFKKEGDQRVAVLQGMDAAALRQAPAFEARQDRVEEAVSARPDLLGPNVCFTKNICTPVQIFFGTDRKRQDTMQRVSFGPERAGQLQLGRAIVTVPRSGRKIGEINRPTWWERWILRVPDEGDPAKHFTIPKGGVVVYDTVEKFVAAVKNQPKGSFEDHALIFVHGYRFTFDDALYRSAQIAYDLSSGGDVPFGTTYLYTWPSYGAGLTGLVGYKYDSESATFAVPFVREFLEMVIDKTPAKKVHIIAHSMGSDPILKALDEMRKSSPNKQKIENLVFAAPDFDAKEFEKIANRIRPIAKSVTLYASSKDWAMEAARTAHLGHARAGDILENGRPVIVKRTDSIDVSAISTDVLALAHAEYADRKELLNDIDTLLRTGKHPPRSILYRKQGEGEAIWWKYAQ